MDQEMVSKSHPISQVPLFSDFAEIRAEETTLKCTDAKQQLNQKDGAKNQILTIRPRHRSQRYCPKGFFLFFWPIIIAAFGNHLVHYTAIKYASIKSWLENCGWPDRFRPSDNCPGPSRIALAAMVKTFFGNL